MLTVAVRSDAGRADYFLNGFLAPPMVALGQDVELVKETCNGTLTEGCQQSVIAADNQVKKVSSVIDHATIPTCIAIGVAKVKVDMANAHTALSLATKGYTDSLASEVSQGVANLVGPAQRGQADAAAATAQKAACDTQHVGP